VERLFDNMLQKVLAAMASPESRSVDDLLKVGQDFRFVLRRLADSCEGCRVGGAIDFPSHMKTPVDKKVSYPNALALLENRRIGAKRSLEFATWHSIGHRDRILTRHTFGRGGAVRLA
jgi:hypothetical protein